MSLRLDIGSVKATIVGLDSTFGKVAMSKAIIEGGMFIQAEIRRNINVTDHTLADLRRLGHPYAKRHGRIRVHPERPWLVHRQGGSLLGSLRRKTIRRVGMSKVQIWLDTTKAPHARYVVMGSQHMLGRNVLWNTATDARVRRETMRVIVKVLGKDLKSKAGIRFGTIAGSGTAI